jgi:hypothetical protein
MNEIRIQKHIVIGQDGGGCVMGDNLTLLKDVGIIGNVWYRIKIMRCNDHSLAGVGPTHEKINDATLAFGVKGCRWLVK